MMPLKWELDNQKIKYLENVSALKYSTMKTPGILSMVIPINSVKTLQKVMKILGNKPYAILGYGSNTLFAESFIETPIILFRSNFNSYKIFGKKVLVEAGVSNVNLVLSLAKHNLGGIEFLAGIPGSIGGSVVMNASCYGKSISDVLYKVLVYNDGQIYWLNYLDCKFGYRTSIFKQKKIIVLKVLLQLSSIPETITNERVISIIKKKSEDQVMNLPSLGSTFKNPEGMKAYELIKSVNITRDLLQASISTKHANFIVNPFQDSGKSILQLIKEIKRKVEETTSVKLEEEIVIIEK